MSKLRSKFIYRLSIGVIVGIISITFPNVTFAERVEQVDTDVSAKLINAKSGLLMEASTGEVLYEVNADERLQIASVTKTMTMLLVMEAVDSGKISTDDIVTVSEYAASMGGSQVFLEAGEQMSVNDMMKAIAVASGNDAAVAMAEFVSGSESAFVEKMNKRAEELGCQNTHFINCNGLDETAEHFSTARDIAVISRELLKHKGILDYTTIWMDTLRNGTFGLSNTNKLIRFYQGANGLKTGSTSTAKYCITATAERDGMQLISVVICSPTSAERFSSASAMLDFGFANYTVASDDALDVSVPYVKIVGGEAEKMVPDISGNGFVLKKGNEEKLECEFEIPESVEAPLKKGEKIGEVVYTIEGSEVARRDVVASEDVPKISVFKMFLYCLSEWVKM